ncbi:MAG: hypothetical protein BWY15_00289 [Firmicutes bacterium ADurb.Bin193]|nr:MAG: hypothetical protein BWY15_00289 [Firmicutes bacterium ADurb.Bin193]
MKIRGIFVTVSAVLLIMSVHTAYAADAEYRFTHNDHDTLIIGTVTELGGDTMSIDVADYIVSVRDLNVNAPKKQLRPKTVRLTEKSVKRLHENADSGWSTAFSVGDSVVASLNKKGDKYEIAWGFFKSDGTDYKTLSVEAYSPSTAAMIKDFINSGGKNTEFSFNGNIVSRVEMRDGKRISTVIYNGTEAESTSGEISEGKRLPEPESKGLSDYSAYAVVTAAVIAVLIKIIIKHCKNKNTAKKTGHNN